MNRRGFLQAILAAGVAPAFVKAGSLMVPRGLAPLTVQEITRAALLLLEKELVMPQGMYKYWANESVNMLVMRSIRIEDFYKDG